MSILVVGLGSIGKRHVRNLKCCGVKELVGYDKNPEVAKKAKSEIEGLSLIESLDSVQDRQFQAAFICTPSACHVAPSLSLAKKKIHLFIEKPISHTLEGLKELAKIAKRNRLISLVGCNYKFHPGLITFKKALRDREVGRVTSARIEYGMYLPDWHPWEDYRHGYSANRRLGGGILLDRIHEIDYADWLFGKPRKVIGCVSKASSLEMNVEDNVDVLMRYDDGLVVSIHMDYIKRRPNCSCEVIGQEGTIRWDFYKHSLEKFDRKSSMYLWRDPHYDLNSMYLEETAYFLKCLKRQEKSFFGIERGIEILKLAMKIKESSREGKVLDL